MSHKETGHADDEGGAIHKENVPKGVKNKANAESAHCPTSLWVRVKGEDHGQCQ